MGSVEHASQTKSKGKVEMRWDVTMLCSQSLSHSPLFVTPWSVCSLPDSSVHGILQARILEWVAISFSSYYIAFTQGNYLLKKKALV